MNTIIKTEIIAIITVLGAAIVAVLALVWFNVQQKNQYEQRITELQLEAARHRQDRDRIRDIWEATTLQNDMLVRTQTSQRDAIDQYIDEVKRTVRFVNTKPDLLPTANETNYTERLTRLTNQMNTYEDIIRKNTIFKTDAKEKIDSIYLQADQSQSNRADPDKGVR